MNNSEKNNINQIIDSLNAEIIDEKLSALILQDRFISEIEELMEVNGNMSRKVLAEKLNTSSSYITQLFRGKKFLNFLTLSKLQRIFNIQFKIEAVSNEKIESDNFYFEGGNQELLIKLINKNRKAIFANIPQPSYDMEINEISENEDIAA